METGEPPKGAGPARSRHTIDTRKESIYDDERDERDDERRHGSHDAGYVPWHDAVASPAGRTYLGTHHLAQSPVEQAATNALPPTAIIPLSKV